MAQLDRYGTFLNQSERILYARASDDELQRDISSLSTSPVVDGLMKTIGGLFAVLNSHRQIVAVNDVFLRYLGVRDGGALLGLRPGESINCLHAHDTPGGCGTGPYCASCGAAIAIATSLARNSAVERKCAAMIEKNGKVFNLCLNVRSTPYAIGGQRFVMLILQDITEQETRAELEEVFFHDLANLAAGLVGSSEILARECGDYREVAGVVHRNAQRLSQELHVQKSLLQIENGIYVPTYSEVALKDLLAQLRDQFALHSLARNKALKMPDPVPAIRIVTDPPLLARILTNMITNAFEATDEGGEVRLRISRGDDAISFSVWNRRPIPETIALRVFQRYFSTKAEYGRGIGTYMMKKFGEEVLGGKVSFTSTDEGGTQFRITLPLR